MNTLIKLNNYINVEGFFLRQHLKVKIKIA